MSLEGHHRLFRHSSSGSQIHLFLSLAAQESGTEESPLSGCICPGESSSQGVEITGMHSANRAQRKCLLMMLQ